MSDTTVPRSASTPLETLSAVERLQRAYVAQLYRDTEVWWNRLRMRVGCWVMGGDYRGIIMRLWLVRERAMRAVGADGRVTLADCAPLAEVLYEPMPGKWVLTVTRVMDADLPLPSDSEAQQ